MSNAPAPIPAVAPSVVVVGSVAFDSIRTPGGARARMLGGSASYSALASALFAPTGLVGVVGSDFPAEYFDLYRRAGIDLRGLEQVEGKTFFWEAEYDATMDDRETLCTELNTFAGFAPAIPEAYRAAPVLVLGNIAPSLQKLVLDQMSPKLCILDTMNLWIDTARDELLEVVARADLLTVNEHEARALSGKTSLVEAAGVLRGLGPEWVLVKKGSHGAFLLGPGGIPDIVLAPAWPLAAAMDPTGAGDSFAGSFAASVAAAGCFDREAYRDALAWATVVAARTCGAFGVDALLAADRASIAADRAAYSRMLVR